MVLQTSRRGSFVLRTMGREVVHDLRSESTGEQFVLCLDAKSGKSFGKKLSFLSLPAIHKFNSFIRHSLCRLRARLRILDYQGIERPSCLDHNGALFGDFGRFQTQHGNGFSPVVKAKSWSSPTTMKWNPPSCAWIAKRGGPYGNGSRRVQTLFIHSPRLPNWNRGEAAIRKQLEISWLLWRIDGQAKSSGKRARHIGFAERILPCFCLGAILRFLRIGRARKQTSGHPSALESGPVSSSPIRFEENAPYVPTPLPLEDMLFLISDGGSHPA